MIAIRVNGADRALHEGATLADAVSALTRAPGGIAVALDGAVVPRSQWPATALREGAQVEVVTAVQGG